MLKEQVIELISRYESGEDNLTAADVLEELEDILDEHGDNSATDIFLSGAARRFVYERHEAKRYGGRADDGSDRFIENIERIVGYK